MTVTVPHHGTSLHVNPQKSVVVAAATVVIGLVFLPETFRRKIDQ